MTLDELEERLAMWDDPDGRSSSLLIVSGAPTAKLLRDLIAAYREAQRDKERLDCIARRLLDGWPEYPGIDGFDTQDLLEETGFLERSTVTAEDCADGWPADWDLSEGDDCLRVSARGRTAIDAARQKGEG